MLNNLVNIWYLICAKHKKKTFTVLLITIIGTVLEAVGIGVLIPVISLIANGDVAKKSPYLEIIIDRLGDPSNATLAFYGALILLSVVSFKSAYLAFMHFQQARYVFGVREYLSSALFEKYLLAPHHFHLGKNSSQLMRNINVETLHFLNNVLNPAMLLVTELTVVFGLVALLLYFAPVSAVTLLLVGTVSIIFFQRLTKRYLTEWGVARQLYEGHRFKRIQEGLGANKDIKLLGRESHFLDDFNHNNKNLSLVEGNYQALSNTPKLWLEMVAVFGIATIILINTQSDAAENTIITSIGIFAATAFRLMPSANRIVSSMHSLRYGAPVIELLTRELSSGSTKIQQDKSGIQFTKNITLKNVCFSYSQELTDSISDVNLMISKGESIGIIGKSGAGKSTLIDIILGFLEPKSGEVCVDGVDIRLGLRSWQSQVGYVQQTIFLTDDTLRRNIAFGLSEEAIDDELVALAIKSAQLDDFVSNLPHKMNTVVGERGVKLSGGQRQRIGIARAIYHNPPILVLDEATSALDYETELGVMQAINALRGSRTVIIIAHRLSTINNCDKVYKLDNGKLSIDEGRK